MLLLSNYNLAATSRCRPTSEQELMEAINLPAILQSIIDNMNKLEYK